MSWMVSGGAASAVQPTAGGAIYTESLIGGGISTTQQIINTANEVMLFPFTLPFALTVTRGAFCVTTGVASQTADVGIYNSAGVLLVNLGALSVASSAALASGVITQSSVTLNPGAYYLGQTASATTVKFQVLENGAINTNIWNIAGMNLRGGTAVNTAVAGALPATTGGLNAFAGGSMWYPILVHFVN